MKPLLDRHRWPIYWLSMAGVNLLARMITNLIHASAMHWATSLENAAIYATLFVGTMRLLRVWR